MLPNGNWVNPAHVTCIEVVERGRGCATRVWVTKGGGYYNTGSFEFDGDQRRPLSEIINEDLG